jgi:hypothetical protein
MGRGHAPHAHGMSPNAQTTSSGPITSIAWIPANPGPLKVGMKHDQDAITVLQTLDSQPCNKLVVRNSDGRVEKGKYPEGGRFRAHTVEIPDLAKLAEVLREVGERPDVLISLSVYNNPPADVWTIIPQREMAGRLGVDINDRQALLGWKDFDGEPTCCRLKENTTLSRFLLFDRDMAPGMPQELEAWSFKDWCEALDRLFPGFAGCGKLWMPSTSNPVLVEGVPIGSNSGHCFVQVADPDEIEVKWRQAALRSLITTFSPVPWKDPLPLAFAKPIKGRKTGEVTHRVWWPLFDKSVATAGRLVYDGAPVVQGGGLTVAPPRIDVHDGALLDLSLVKDLTQREWCEVRDAISRIRGKRTTFDFKRERVSKDGTPRLSEITEVVDDLTLDLEVETPSGWTTVRALIESGVEHIRLQSPFRDSSSWAAFFSTLGGSPFVFDVGDRTKHVLDSEKLRPALAIGLEAAREYYRPLYRTEDHGFYSETLGAVVHAHHLHPTQAILDALKLAHETPRENGRLKPNATVTTWKAWKSAIFGELLKQLPTEREARSSTAAAEAFTHQLRTLLLTQISLESGYSRQRHSLGVWAMIYACRQIGKWVQVSSLPLWGKVARKPSEHDFIAAADVGLEIAIKPGLATVARCAPDIAKLTDDADLTQLCRKYGLLDDGDSRITCRGNQFRVTKLDSRSVLAGLELSYSLENNIENRLYATAQELNLNASPADKKSGYFAHRATSQRCPSRV